MSWECRGSLVAVIHILVQTVSSSRLDCLTTDNNQSFILDCELLGFLLPSMLRGEPKLLPGLVDGKQRVIWSFSWRILDVREAMVDELIVGFAHAGVRRCDEILMVTNKVLLESEANRLSAIACI